MKCLQSLYLLFNDIIRQVVNIEDLCARTTIIVVLEAPGTQRPNDRLKNQSQEPHQRNSVEEKVVRFLTVESLSTHMMENEEKWGTIILST